MRSTAMKARLETMAVWCMNPVAYRRTCLSIFRFASGTPPDLTTFSSHSSQMVRPASEFLKERAR